MSDTRYEQPEVGVVELSECPRNRWYQDEGRELRAAGWRLRQQGDKWNATHALIERRAAAVGFDGAAHERGNAFGAAPGYAALVAAAKKVRLAMECGLTHALICNFQEPECARCNCGLADVLTALEIAESETPHNIVLGDAPKE